MSDMSALRKLDKLALLERLVKLEKEAFNLRMDVDNQKVKTHRFRLIRKTVARIKTIFKERG